MGGRVALTIRKSDGKEWRGSCHTNILPYRVWDAPFYAPETSEAHISAFLDELLENRRVNPEIETLWGCHHKLAPVEYGLVVIDYKTGTFISAQGYSRPDRLYGYNNATADSDAELKRRALERMGLLGESIKPDIPGRFFYHVKLLFNYCVVGDEVCLMQDGIEAWCQAHFVLSAREVAAWNEYKESLK